MAGGLPRATTGAAPGDRPCHPQRERGTPAERPRLCGRRHAHGAGVAGRCRCLGAGARPHAQAGGPRAGRDPLAHRADRLGCRRRAAAHAGTAFARGRPRRARGAALMWGWLRRRRSAPPLPDDLWRATLARYPFLAERPAEELAQLRGLSAEFLAQKQFHGAGGLVISDEIALAIAAQAVLPVLHLGLHWYDDFVGIVVHPEEVVARRSATDETGVVHDWDEVLAGEAMQGGPVMVNWRDVAAAGESARTGFNVVIHEFVHKIDLRDGVADGCPPLRSRA